jgi:Barstar (barnase inhibitor)
MTPLERVLSPEEPSVIELPLPLLEAEGLRADLVESGVFVAALTLTGAETDAEVLRLLAHAAHFPLYFGGNWNAVDDCLLDVEGFGATRGFVLLVAGATPAPLERLADAISFAVPFWAEAGLFARLVVIR